MSVLTTLSITRQDAISLLREKDFSGMPDELICELLETIYRELDFNYHIVKDYSNMNLLNYPIYEYRFE